MAYFNKVGLVILNSDGTKFLVCEKGSFTTDYLTPGGKIEKGESDEECLAREIKEELNVEINKDSLKYINTYMGSASGDNTKDVSIKLYKGEIIDEPTPSQEIIKLHWIGKEDTTNIRVSPIIRYKIIPDLIKKGILK
jgi:8-oxo-dGTP diphosphatase